MKERTKKLKKLSKSAVVLAAAIAMSATTAMAATPGWSGTDKNGNTIANTDAELGKDIVIGKSLKMPLNWTPTSLNITFDVTPKGFSTDNTSYTTVDGLTFGDKDDNKIELTLNDFTAAKQDEKTQVKYWGAQTEDLVDLIEYNNKEGLEAIAEIAKEKQSTGTVKFTVTEEGFTYSDNTKTTSIASEASYDLVFWIDYVANSDGTGSYKVTSITDTKTKSDNGEDTNQKVDPTPDSTDVTETTYENSKIVPKENTDLSYDLSGMLFNNDITKSDEPNIPDTPTPDDYAFALTKTNVNGDKNQEFEFTVNLTAPDLGGVAADKTITAKVYDANNNEVTDKATTLTYGTDKTIKLKGGEKVVFGQMYNSTLVTINETGTPSYTPSVSGSLGTKNAAMGEALSVSGVTKLKTDTVKYTNTYSSITPTGIIMNNLPFFMMILIGAAAVVAGFAFQARRRVADK